MRIWPYFRHLTNFMGIRLVVDRMAPATHALLFTVLLATSFQSTALAANKCVDLYKDAAAKNQASVKAKISETELLSQVSRSLPKTEEFNFIRAEAKKMGLRVWMFGGTASSYLHYVKWDLARQKGMLNLQADRFDYDFTNIFRSTQDLDIVVDGSMEQIQALQNSLSQKFPYFVGSKKAWEVRSLKTPIGKPGDGSYKEALLNDPNFSNQNTDTNSLAMVEISESKDPVVRDLRAWTTGKNQFLEDSLNNTISYLRNPLHKTTARAKLGQNPEILSVMRLLVKAFQYDLVIDPKSMDNLKDVINQFSPKSLTDQAALRRTNEIAAKLVLHSNNIERAMNVLDQLGLRQKLQAMNLKDHENDANFWLNKEPLRSFAIPANAQVTELPKYTSGLLKTASFHPTGKTAKDLGLEIVAHETNSFAAYESITRSHSGEPNVLISRGGAEHEQAALGDGFYTAIGRIGARGTGLTIRFSVNPMAREGVDFIRHDNYVVFLNKKALRVIQESLRLGIAELVDLIENEKLDIDHSDKGIFEKLKRRLNVSRIQAELEGLMLSKNSSDQEKFEAILTSMVTNEKIKEILTAETVSGVVKQAYAQIVSVKKSRDEKDILRYIRIVSHILPELIASKTLTKNEFETYLRKQIGNQKSSELVSSAVIELALIDGVDSFVQNLNLQGLNLASKELVIQKIRSFDKSKDARKRNVHLKFTEEKENALKENSYQKFENLIKLGFLDINAFNVSGHSLLLEAAYYEAKSIIDFLISNPKFDLQRKNKDGNNDIEELRLLGKNKIAAYIEKRRPDIKSKKFAIEERNDKKTELYPEGEPIIDFIQIEPGTFMMGESEKVPVILTKGFNILSVDTTNKMWNQVVQLIHTHFPRQFNLLIESRLSSPDQLNEPVVNISFNEVSQQWLVGLNQLSRTDNASLQRTLAKLFPRHFLAKNYRLPTEAEWEYVSRLEGLATGDFSFGNSRKNLTENAWFDENSEHKKQLVGLKKPVLIKGQPIYDLHGNVLKYTSDLYRDRLLGGIDPKGAPSGIWHVVRGGSASLPSKDTKSSARLFVSSQTIGVGFRLVGDLQ